MNIQDFTKTVNQLIAQEKTGTSQVSDSRIKEEISERRIRDYLNKGILSRPEKDGKSLVFTQDHVEQVLAIRALQSQGVTDSALWSTIDTQSAETKSFGKSYYGLNENLTSSLTSPSLSSLSGSFGSPAPFSFNDSLVTPQAASSLVEPIEYNFETTSFNATSSSSSFLDENHPKNLFNQIKNTAKSTPSMMSSTRSIGAPSIPKISNSFSSSTRSTPLPLKSVLTGQSLNAVSVELESIAKEKTDGDNSLASHQLKMGTQELPQAWASLEGLNVDKALTTSQSVSKYSFGPVDVFINDNQLSQCSIEQKEQIAKAIENVIKKNN